MRYYVDREFELIIAWIPAGSSAGEILSSLAEVQAQGELDYYNELTLFKDLNSMMRPEDGYDGMQEIARSSSDRYGDNPDWRSAYVVFSKLDYGFARAYMTWRGRHPDVARAFLDDIDAAPEFVGIPREASARSAR